VKLVQRGLGSRPVMRDEDVTRPSEEQGADPVEPLASPRIRLEKGRKARDRSTHVRLEAL
jgi:hypothetical protein